MRKEKPYLNLKQPQKQELKSYEIDQFQYLIKWKNLPTENSTWHDENFIQKHLELLKRRGQHFFEGDEHVRSLYY